MEKLDLIIVDDDKFMHKVFDSMIEGQDLSYEFYDDSKKALDAILEKKPSCVLLDYNMPEMSGKDMIIKLSENHVFQHSSIYLITAEDFSDIERMKMMTLGFEKIIDKKDLQKETFLVAISEVIDDVKLHVA